MNHIISAFQLFSMSVFLFLSLACGGCISSTVRKSDGTVHHFASVAQNLQKVQYNADGSFSAEGVDSSTVTGQVTTGVVQKVLIGEAGAVVKQGVSEGSDLISEVIQ